jgi:hypothetical protein
VEIYLVPVWKVEVKNNVQQIVSDEASLSDMQIASFLLCPCVSQTFIIVAKYLREMV